MYTKMWMEKFLMRFLSILFFFAAETIVYGIEGQTPAEKACKELENDAKFPEIQDSPFNVAVIYEEGLSSSSNTSYYGCAGVLIAKKFVLTAGHCVNNEKSISVLLGLPQTYDVNGRSASIYMRVKAISIHPNYKAESLSNDIAVLQLENEISYTKDIYPICLQTVRDNFGENTTLFVSGIQRDENRKLVTDVLLKGRAQFASGKKCNETFGKIEDVQLCVADSEEVCETISGSALVLITKNARTGRNRQLLVGLKVAGFPCFHNKLRIYTKIAAQLSFIENIVWPKHK